MKKLLESIKLKKFLQFFFFLTFPVTLNFFSPYVIIVSAFEGIVNASAITFVILLVGGIFLGRLFCSTICPAGTIGDYLSEVRTKSVKNGWYNAIKILIWIPWLMGIVAGVISVGGYKAIDVLFMTDGGISVNRPEAYIIYFFVTGLIVFMNLSIGKRAACHYICWMAPFMMIGMKIRQLFRLPGLTLDSKKGTCISCSKCNKACPMCLDVNGMVQDKKMTNTECILCGKCINICPKNTIEYSFKRG